MTDQDEDAAPGGSSTRTVPGPAPAYVAGVRAELADLPPAEVAEMLDDVSAHLADLTGELGEGADLDALTARLGTPAAYAAELRAAAGFPAPRPERRRPPAAARFAVIGLVGSTLLLPLALLGPEPGFLLLAGLVALLAVPLLAADGPRVPSVAGLPEVRRWRRRPASGTSARTVTDFVASLQPAWWVLRAVAAALAVALVLGDGVLLPLLILVAVPVSVWLGHRTRRDRRLLWLVVPLNGLTVAVLLVAAGIPWSVGIGGTSDPGPVDDGGAQYGSYLGGREVADIRPVDSAGTPLTGVYLFDQDGRIIDLPQQCDDAEPTPDPNRPYPRGVREYDPITDRCVSRPPGPLVVAVPTPTATPAPVSPAAPGPVPPPVPVPPTG